MNELCEYLEVIADREINLSKKASRDPKVKQGQTFALGSSQVLVLTLEH